ncbi:MAG: cobalt ECF transporter T component CbiQ, partial [Desulfurivibrio sp.]
MTDHTDNGRGRQGWLQGRDPRSKLVGLLGLTLAFAMVADLRLVPLMLAVAMGLTAISGLSGRFIFRRLRYPSLLLLTLLVTMPLLVGETELLGWGVLALHREGLEAALLIGSRFLAIVLSALVLLNTSPPADNIKAMRALGLPWIMVDMALLVLRYLQVIGNDLGRMRTAMRSRGFNERRFSPAGLKNLAWLSGSLLLRSYERSDWIYRAMRLRGYG